MKEIREAVNIVRQNCYLSSPEIHNALLTLLDLAEKVLAVKIPEKKKHSDWDCGDAHCIVCEDRGYNRAIDDCRIAITGALLSEEGLENIMWNIDCLCEDCGGQGYIGYAINSKKISCEKCGGDEDALGKGVNFKGIATAIHSAQMEKLGGGR